MAIQSIGIIGAGQMGNGIAHVCAAAGYPVRMLDVNEEAVITDPIFYLVAAAAVTLAAHPQDDGFKFKSGVELINVTATVTDRTGRFLSGLTKTSGGTTTPPSIVTSSLPARRRPSL